MKFVKFLAKSLVVIFALVGLLVVLGVFAIGTAWRSLPGVAIAPPPPSMVLTMDLADGLSEAAPDSPFSFAGLDKSVTMLDAVRGIEAAAKDSRVKVLLLHLGSGELDLAHAQELGDAVADFRKSGKFALAFAESFGEAGSGGSHYLLATSANEVWLQPSGDLLLAGAALQTPFLRGLMDKLGVVARMDRREEYKGALESLMADSMSPPVRANLQLLVDAWVDQLAKVSGIGISDFASYLGALRKRHDFFHARGCRLSDHGLSHCYADLPTEGAANSLFNKVRYNHHKAGPDEHEHFAAYMMVFLPFENFSGSPAELMIWIAPTSTMMTVRGIAIS